MKKTICFILIVLSMLTLGITLLFPGIDVQAEIAGTDAVQFVLVGYSGSNPASYFTDKDEKSTFVNAKTKTPDKKYINKKGEVSDKYNIICGNHTSVGKAKSSGRSEIYPGQEMQKIISSGQMSMKVSCGILALNDSPVSKITILVQIYADGKVCRTLKLSSDKVSSNKTVYDPEWVESNLISLPSNTEKIVFSFENPIAATRLNPAKFCLFEPTITFGTNLNECKMLTQSQSLKIGQVLKLSSTNFIQDQTSTSYYFEYYKKIHTISYEIVEGQEFAKIVGNYLYVDTDAPTGAKIVVRAKCRKSSLTGEYLYSENVTFMLDVAQTDLKIETDFDAPARFLGEGKYFVGDYATVSFLANSGFEFVGWQRNGNIVSNEKTYTFRVENNSNIKAVFIKTIKIKQVVVKSKTYDGTTKAEVENVLLDGVENSHDVKVSGLVANFATSSVGEQKLIEFSSIPTLSGNDKDIYRLENKVPQTSSSILQRPLEIRADAISKIYGENDPKLTFSASGLVAGESVLGVLQREAGENAGNYEIKEGNLSSLNPNYKISFVGAKFVIQKREIKLSEVGAVSKVYDKTTNATIFATASNVVLGDDVSATFEANFVDANAGTNKQVKINKISLIGLDAENYYVDYKNPLTYGTITPRPLLVVTEAQTFCYGDLIEIGYQAGGLLNGDKLDGELQISSNQVGKYLIAIGTLFNPNYEINLQAEYVEIVPKNITVQALSNSKTYGEEDPILRFSVSGLVEGDELFGAMKREAGENVGVYQIGVGSLNNANYNIDFVSANFEILKRQAHVEFVVEDKTYDGTTKVQYSYTLLNTLEKDAVAIQTDLAFIDKNVGNNKKVLINKIEIVGDNSQNYLLIYDENLIFASIFAKNVQISANSVQKTYGENDPQIVLQFSGVIDGEQITGELQRTHGEDVGKYLYDIPQSMMLENSNYSLCLLNEIYLDILAKPIEISVASAQKQFGDAEPEIVYLFDQKNFVFGQTFDELSSGVASREVGEEIGRYQYKLGSLSLGDNYVIKFVTTGFLTISKRDIEIKANSLSKIYGENDPTFSFVQTNIVSGVSSTIKLKREKGENVGAYKITYESLDDPHYNIAFISGELVILPRDISVKVEDTFKYYGENDPVVDFVLYLGTLQFEDDLSTILRGEISRVAGEDAGEYEITQGTLSAGENYNLTFVSGKLYIYPQELSIKLKDATKFYGESDPVFEYEILSGDKDVKLNGKAKRIYGENVGKYEIDAGTLLAPKNYKLKCICGTLLILPRKIEVTACPASKIYGESDPEFSYEITSGSLVDSNDLSGEIYRENVGIKIYESVGKYPLLSNLKNPNYEIMYVGSELSINQREIVVSTKSVSSIYGEEIMDDFEYTIEGEILAGDTLTGGLYKAEGEDAGRYPIRCNINLGRNYKVRYIQAYYEILPRTLVVTLGENQKTYSNPDPTFNLEILKGELVDGEQLEWEVEREQNDDVGEYALNVKSRDDNYFIVTYHSILVISKKDVKLNVELLDKVYDKTPICKIKNPVVSGLVDNEIMLDYDKNTCAMFSTIEPGNDIEVKLSGFSLVGGKAKNYNLVLPSGLVASITYANLEKQNVQVSTYSSTAMKFGTVLDVKNIETDKNYNGKKVVQSMRIGLYDKNGAAINLDRALDIKFFIKDLNNYNNIHVYGKDKSGNFVELSFKSESNNILISTSTLDEFVIVCDDENWIDIAMYVCVGLILAMGLGMLLFGLIKNKKHCTKK